MKQYESYKPSGVEFIGDIPKHWEVRKLKYCMKDKITDGPHETPKFISEGIPFLSVDGIQNGELVFENCRKISEKAHKEYSKKALVEYDDILLGKAASIGKIARVKVDFEFSIWSPLALIKANKEVVLPIFLEYSLKTKMVQYQIETLATNNTQKNISMADIPRFILTIPPLQEQEKIANFLDTKNKQIEEFIKEKQHQIALLEEQKEAIINQAVTKGLDDSVKMKYSGIEWIGDIPEHWKTMKLKYIAKVYNGATPKSTNKDFWDGDIIWVTPQDISPLKSPYINTSLRTITKDGYNNCGTYLVPINSIILTTRAPIGNIAISKTILCTNQGCKSIVVNDGYEYKFIYYILIASKIILQSLGTGTTFLELSTDKLKAFNIPTAPKNEQIKIIKYIEEEFAKMDEVIKQIQKEIDLIKEYKISLISEVVTGQINVR